MEGNKEADKYWLRNKFSFKTLLKTKQNKKIKISYGNTMNIKNHRITAMLVAIKGSEFTNYGN